MTENKRFNLVGGYLYDGEECVSHFNDPLHRDGIVDLLNELHEENMNLRAKHTQMIIILKDVVNDLKRMDTYRYAEHLEKIANLHFLSEKELEE